MAAEDITERQPGVTPGVMAQAIGAECLGRCADCGDAQNLLASANAHIEREEAAISGLEARRQHLVAELDYINGAIRARGRTIELVQDGVRAVPVRCPGPRIVTVRNIRRDVVGRSVTCQRPTAIAGDQSNGQNLDV